MADNEYGYIVRMARVGVSRQTSIVSIVVNESGCAQLQILNFNTSGETIMWTKPEFTEMRFGFEVTMYIYNR